MASGKLASGPRVHVRQRVPARARRTNRRRSGSTSSTCPPPNSTSRGPTALGGASKGACGAGAAAPIKDLDAAHAAARGNQTGILRASPRAGVHSERDQYRIQGQNPTLTPSDKLNPAPPPAGLRYHNWKRHVDPGTSTPAAGACAKSTARFIVPRKSAFCTLKR